MRRRKDAADANPPPRRRAGVGRLLLGAVPWAGMAALGALWVSAAAKPQPGLSKQVVAAPEHFEALEPGRGRLAEHPHHIPWRGWRDVAWRTYREVSHDRLTAVAGSVTFYTLLAVFPALGVFVSLYGLIADVGQVSDQLIALNMVFPRQVVGIVGDQMIRLTTQRPEALSLAFLVSLLLSVWSSNAAMKALFEGLNVAYDEVEKRNFFFRNVLTYAFTFALIAFLALMTGILVAAPPVLDRLGLWSGWLIPARWLLLLGLATVAFAIVYRHGPCRARARWRWVTWGAAMAAVAWMSGSLVFSWYLNHVAHFDVTYGSLGAVIGFMLWIWFSVVVVLIGAELNAEIEHQTALDSTTGAPMPMGQRGAAMADTVGLAFVGVRQGVGILWRDTRRQVGNLVRRPPPKP
ncbi:MAG: YihY/virulence factor BrkB family protein [Phenylobacterium sp.]